MWRGTWSSQDCITSKESDSIDVRSFPVGEEEMKGILKASEEQMKRCEEEIKST